MSRWWSVCVKCGLGQPTECPIDIGDCDHPEWFLLKEEENSESLD